LAIGLDFLRVSSALIRLAHASRWLNGAAITSYNARQRDAVWQCLLETGQPCGQYLDVQRHGRHRAARHVVGRSPAPCGPRLERRKLGGAAVPSSVRPPLQSTICTSSITRCLMLSGSSIKEVATQRACCLPACYLHNTDTSITSPAHP